MNNILKTTGLSSNGDKSLFPLNHPVYRAYFWSAILGTSIQFIIFKLLYPFPDFFSDSYSYIYAASANLDVSIWPIGYSKLLRIFHYITHSDTILVAFQYFFLMLSALYFFFTTIHFFNPSKPYKITLFIFLFLNPLFLYLANYVNSDPIFAALSLLWITQLLWILFKPNITLLFTHALLLFLCFTVRNNAYYYPIVSIVAFLLSRQKRHFKVIGITLPFLLIIPFIIHTRNEAFKLTGTHQFSLFTGWQLANNALYMYDKIEVDSTKFTSAGSRELDHLSKQFIREIPADFEFRKYLNIYVGNYFIRQPESPLKVYLTEHYDISDNHNITIAWGKSSALFAEYGTSLIKAHPGAYFRYFILLNTKNYFLPPLEKLSVYNLGVDNVPVVVQEWFDYKTPDVWCVSNKIQKYILYILPPAFLFVNILYAATLIGFVVKKRYAKSGNIFNSAMIVLFLLIFLNFLFTVLATINVFRYQVFPMVACLMSFLVLSSVLDTIVKRSEIKGLESSLAHKLA